MPLGLRGTSGVITAVLGAAIACLFSTTAKASPPDIFGYGSRSTALGATGTASAEGSEAVWSNPALLSMGTKRELTLGFQAAKPLIYAREGRGMPGNLNGQPMKGTLIAAFLPLPLGGVMANRLGVGLAFFTPTDVVVRGRVLYPETPQMPILVDRMQTVSIQAGVGLDIGYGIRLGFGFSALAAISGGVLVATDASGNVGTKVDDQLVATYAKTFGISYDIGKHYRAGIVVRESLAARFSVQIQVNDLGSLEVPPLNIAGLAQYDPWQVQGELARVDGHRKLALGFTYKRWSNYPGAQEPTVICPGPCQALVPPAPNFHNTIVPRAGAQLPLAEEKKWLMLARVGYFYEPSPAPEQTGDSNSFDNDRHVLTFGYGLELKKPWIPIRLDWFQQVHMLTPRTHHKQTGDGNALGAPQTVTGGWVLFGGMAASVRF
jgi:long-chain fatty acid transport protein